MAVFNGTEQTISLNIGKIVSGYILGFPCGSADKESACNAGDPGSIPGLERFPWTRERPPSGLEYSMDCIVHGVEKSRTQLRDFRFHFQEHLENCGEAGNFFLSLFSPVC